MEELKIEIPVGYEVDLENSSLKNGVVKFKQLSDIPFEKIGHKINGYWISKDDDAILPIHDLNLSYGARSVFKTENLAKKSLAMAQISQWMPQYGGEITRKEWSSGIKKYTIERFEGTFLKDERTGHYEFLAFRTPEFREKFIREHKSLIKDYLMLTPTEDEKE